MGMQGIQQDADGWLHWPRTEYMYEGWAKLLPDPHRPTPYGGRAILISCVDGDFVVMNKQDQILYGHFSTLAEAKIAGQAAYAKEVPG